MFPEYCGEDGDEGEDGADEDADPALQHHLPLQLVLSLDKTVSYRPSLEKGLDLLIMTPTFYKTKTYC